MTLLSFDLLLFRTNGLQNTRTYNVFLHWEVAI